MIIGCLFSAFVLLEGCLKECKGDNKTANDSGGQVVHRGEGKSTGEGCKDDKKDANVNNDDSKKRNGKARRDKGRKDEKVEKVGKQKPTSMVGLGSTQPIAVPQMMGALPLHPANGMSPVPPVGVKKGHSMKMKSKNALTLPPSSLMIYGTKDINLGMKIGAGGFADVFKAIFRNSELGRRRMSTSWSLH